MNIFVSSETNLDYYLRDLQIMYDDIIEPGNIKLWTGARVLLSSLAAL